MPSNYKTPGVYVQEISTLPASVAAVETAIPAFIGYTAIDPGEPVKISSMLEFESTFGGPNPNAITLTLDSTGSPTVTADYTDYGVYKLYHSMQMFYNNGGGDCYVVSAGVYAGTASVVKGDLTAALATLVYEDEPTMIVIPDAASLGTEADYGDVASAVLAQCASLQDRFGIFDVIGTISTYRGALGTQNLKYGAAYYPNLVTTLVNGDAGVWLESATEASLNNITLADAIADAAVTSGTSDDLALYLKLIRDELATLSITVPPSGAIAGIYATVDRTRGVWKAPANISLNSTLKPSIPLTNSDQDDLNDPNDGSGKAINAIRAFTGKGNLVWGARTLAANDLEWRYVPVRRLFNMAEESIKKASEFVVFEPNDANTWQRVKGMIENFLTGLWRDGALAGATPGEAFFVNCGLGTSMTSQDILDGNLIIEVGMAAVRPAEFIILKFSHKLQES